LKGLYFVPVLLYRQDFMVYFIAKQIQAKMAMHLNGIRNASFKDSSILNYYKP
jgi:hypothetical protein